MKPNKVCLFGCALFGLLSTGGSRPPIPTPPLNQRLELTVGSAGWLDLPVKINQIIDQMQMLVFLHEGYGRRVWVYGVSTEEYADDIQVKLDGVFVVSGTYRYTTVLGGPKTVFVIMPMETYVRIYVRESLFPKQEKVEEPQQSKPPTPPVTKPLAISPLKKPEPPLKERYEKLLADGVFERVEVIGLYPRAWVTSVFHALDHDAQQDAARTVCKLFFTRDPNSTAVILRDGRKEIGRYSTTTGRLEWHARARHRR